MQRDEAEKKHGYRLYQGGAVPGKIIRVVEIVGLDAEACGGIHCSQHRVRRPDTHQAHQAHPGWNRPRRIHRRPEGSVRDAAGQVHRGSTGGALERLVRERDRGHPRSSWPTCATRRRGWNSIPRPSLRSRSDRCWRPPRGVNGVRLVVHEVAEGENAEEMSKMLAASPKVVAVIAASGPNPKVLVTRSADVDLDCKTLLKEIMSIIGGGWRRQTRFRPGRRWGRQEDPGRLRQGAGDVRQGLPVKQH